MESLKSPSTTSEVVQLPPPKINPSEVRCHVTARQLILWVNGLGEYGKHSAYEVRFIPNFWVEWSHKKLNIVQRNTFQKIVLILLKAAKPERVQFFHTAGVYFALESLTETEQRRVLEILGETYAPFR